MTMIRVTCCQLSPAIADVAANVAASTAAVRRAVDGGARVVVLPELATSGYVFADRDEAAATAITTDHDVFSAWSREAARTGAVVIVGFCERAGNDNAGPLYNSAAVIDGTGVRAVYRKTHLWDREKLWFAPGATLPPVVDTDVGRIGVAICYDLEFPELTRHLALAGADLVAVPTNWPLVARPDGEHPPEVVIAMAAARTNRMVIACCDRDGTERGQRWTAGTTIIGVDGWPLTVHRPGGVDGDVTAEVDLAQTRVKR
jgi:predicted amidohydrolase